MKTEYSRWISKILIKENIDCWLWIGAKYRKGYGHFRRFLNNKWSMEKAHRYSYEIHNNVSRESMKKLLVCHTCDNPSCVNPNHLFLGTTLDNNTDKLNKNRNNFGNNPTHKLLSLSIANQIRALKTKNPNLGQKEIALIFNTSKTQVCRILQNKIWKTPSKEL